MRGVLSLLCFILFCPSVWAEQLTLRDDSPPLNVGQGVQYLLGHPTASAEEIAQLPASAWQQYPSQTLNLGQQRHGVWVRFTLHNASRYAQGWQLSIPWPVLDQVSLQQYFPASGQWSARQQAGDHLPPGPQAQRYPLFTLDLPIGHSSVIYLQAHATEALILPLQISQLSEHAQSEHISQALIYMFFGGMLVMLLYNSSLALFTRDASYAWYALYLLSVLGYQLSTSGLGHLYLWGHWSLLAAKAYALFASASFLLALVFARYFLRLPQYSGWVVGLNSLLIGYWLLTLLAVLLLPALVPWLQPLGMAILTCISGFVTVLYLWYQGHVSAKLFTVAWSVLTGATVVHVLALIGVLELNWLTQSSQMLGIFLEFVLLSIALAERLNRDRSQRLTAQYNLLLSSRNLALAREEKLQAQQRLLELQQAANHELETRVLLRTEDLEKAKRALEKANAELAALSITDPLTQLYNRRHFDAVIPEELSRAQRSKTPLSILMIDIDHFKKINDTYGHPFGDECLRQVAALIHACAKRAGDIAARFGGEEFILALPATDLEHAHIVAERIRSKTEALPLQHQQQPVQVTLSIGLCSAYIERDTRIEDLISAADSALYQAKHQGRNQVVGHT